MVDNKKRCISLSSRCDPKNWINVSCKICKLKFFILFSCYKTGLGIYCSPKCQQIGKMTGRYKTCPTCNKRFYIGRTQLGQYTHCSIKCSNGRTKITCHCGKEFFTDNNRLKTGRGKYCSR